MLFSVKNRVLLHICCGPDGTVPWPNLQGEGFDVIGYFYGGNIHPSSEYYLRLGAVKAVEGEWGGRLIVPPYDSDPWFALTGHLSEEPEGGRRCSLCFRIQLEAAASAAVTEGIGLMTTTLTISPHKDPEEINSIGREVAKSRGLTWIDRVWRKKNGFKRSLEECGRLGLYRQNYCGCIYSLMNRDDVVGRPCAVGKAPSCGAGVSDTEI
nr:epoxyqueuosine reductase QueH [uncultured Dethiosulfovibrio sp.]